jgi:hypothetical protein
VSAATERTVEESMLNFLPYLNQKVAGYLDSHDKLTLTIDTYKKIVSEVCTPLPSCGKNAEIMFSTFEVQVRTLDSMFSTMLCDKEGKVKKMEDFSCNEQKVEIPNFLEDAQTKCSFEVRWKEMVASFCPN